MAVTLGLKTNISGVPNTVTARDALTNIYDFVNEMLQAAEVDISCAATLDIGGKDSSKLRLTGSPVVITSLGTKYRGPIFIRATNTYVFTNNAVSLLCPGGKNLTVYAGDVLVAAPKVTSSGTADGWSISVLSRGDGGEVFTGQVKLVGANPLVLEGATDNSFSTKVSVVDPTANRTITIPNADVDLTLVRGASPSALGVSREATWTEAQAGLLDGAVFLTPSAFNWARIFNADGYMKFPGTPGLIIQWGVVPITGDIASEVYISKLFPTSFNYYVATVVGVVDGDHDSYVMWRRSATTLNTVAFTVRETTGAAQSGTWGVAYIAIGW